MSKRGRPPKIGAVRNKSGRIRYGKPDIKPKEGPKWSREYQWLVDNLSEPAREAARWYAEWIKHRNYWLGYDEWKLPGDDLTVSTRLGRKSFTALVKVPGAYEFKRPGLSSTGVEPDDREALVLAPSTSLPLTGRFASAGRPSAAEAAAAALQDDAAARLQQQSYKTQKDGPFPPRKPHKPAYAPPPTDNDARCPECTGGCALQKEGNDPCALRERIRADDMALKLILQQRIAPVDDLTVQSMGGPLRSTVPDSGTAAAAVLEMVPYFRIFSCISTSRRSVSSVSMMISYSTLTILGGASWRSRADALPRLGSGMRAAAPRAQGPSACRPRSTREQLGRIERIRAAREIGIEDDLRVLAERRAAVGITAHGPNRIFQHSASRSA